MYDSRRRVFAIFACKKLLKPLVSEERKLKFNLENVYSIED